MKRKENKMENIENKELLLLCEQKVYNDKPYNCYYVVDPKTNIKLVLAPKDNTARALLDSYYQDNKLVK